jgi:hypothetical protein
MVKQVGEDHAASAGSAARAAHREAGDSLPQAGQQYAGKANHPRPAMPTSSSDKCNQRGALYGNAGSRVEQDGPQLPEPD